MKGYFTMAKPSIPKSTFDAVKEAARIVVGDRPPVIDWNREPATEIEALMRRKYIERVIRKEGLYLGTSHLLLLTRCQRYPSDLAHAIFILEAVSREVERQKREAEMADLHREVLFGTAAVADREVTIEERMADIRAAFHPVDPERLIAMIFGGNDGDEGENHAA